MFEAAKRESGLRRLKICDTAECNSALRGQCQDAPFAKRDDSFLATTGVAFAKYIARIWQEPATFGALLTNI